MRVLFLGQPSRFSARALWGCLSAGYEVTEFWYAHNSESRAWSRDRRLGLVNPGWSVSAALRRFKIAKRAVKPLRRNPQYTGVAADLQADVLISAEFPYVVSREILRLFDSRAINLHPAPLPDYRGPFPIIWMLYRKDAGRAGCVTMHLMDATLDTGPIVSVAAVPWTSGPFRRWEAQLGNAAEQLIRLDLPCYLRGEIAPRPQPPVDPDRYCGALPMGSLELDETLSAAHVRHMLDTIGSFKPLKVHIGKRVFKVASFAERRGPRTGEPAKIGPLRIEMDVADARIVLDRWRVWTSKQRRFREFQLFAFTPTDVPASRGVSTRELVAQPY